MKKVFVYFIIFIHFFIRPVYAESNQAYLLKISNIQPKEPNESITLKQAFELAENHNYDIIIAKKNIDLAWCDVKIAKAVPNPQFEFQGGFGPSFYNLFTGQTQQFYFTQQLMTFGKRTKRVNVALANLELAKLNLAQTYFSTHNQIRKAYCELIASNAFKDLTIAQTNIAKQLEAIAQKRFEAGKAAKSEVLQAHLNVVQYLNSMNQANIRIEVASNELAILIGKKLQSQTVYDIDENGLFDITAKNYDIAPDPKKPLMSLKSIINLAQVNRFDIMAAKQKLYSDQWSFKLAVANKYPDLFVAAGYAFTTFATHQPAGLGNAPAQPGVFIAVNANTPIFYQNQGEIAQAKETLAQDKLSLEKLQIDVNHDIISAYNQVRINKNNILFYQNKILPLSANVTKLSRIAYREGLKDLSQAILAQQQYQQTLTDYFNAVNDYNNSWADLELATGVKLK